MQPNEKDNAQYIQCGNTLIRVIEHFSPSGKTLDELMAELILRESEKNEKRAA